MSSGRLAEFNRKTKETDIKIKINLDGSGKSSISTCIPFMDHMLELFSKHGFFDLNVKAKGDIEVDYHHTMEDLGLALGEAVAKALGDKAGIRRYGSCLLPMDEALAQVRTMPSLQHLPIGVGTGHAVRTLGLAGAGAVQDRVVGIVVRQPNQIRHVAMHIACLKFGG